MPVVCQLHRVSVIVDSTSGFGVDEGTGFAIVNGAEIIQFLEVSSATILGYLFRGMFNVPPKNHPNNGGVREMRPIMVGDEIMMYRYASTGGLGSIVARINCIPGKTHYAGELVRELRPVYKWMVNSRKRPGCPIKNKKHIFLLQQSIDSKFFSRNRSKSLRH